MANKKTIPTEPELSREEIMEMNIWSKLLAVRQEFYAVGAKKSGINPHAEFSYFELVDIVPIAEPLFSKYGLLLIPTFPENRAVALVVNADHPEEQIEFIIPMQFIAEPGKFRMHEIQGVGAAVTYYRRYLYMIVLDLVENDSLDGESGGEDKKPAPAKKKPVTTEERKEVKKTLADPDANADELQINALKAALKKLREVAPDKEEFVQAIALNTDSFKSIKKSACEELILAVNQMIEEYEG